MKYIRFIIILFVLLFFAHSALAESNFNKILTTDGYRIEVTLSQNGNYVGTIQNEIISLYDVQGNLIWKNKLLSERNVLISISNDGDMVAIYNKNITLFDKNGEQLYDKNVLDRVVTSDTRNRLDISPDGDFIALHEAADSDSWKNSKVVLTFFNRNGDIRWEKQLEDIANPQQFSGNAFFQSGILIVSAISNLDNHDYLIYAFDKNGEKLMESSFRTTIRAIDLSPDERYIMVSGASSTYILDENGDIANKIKKFMGIGFLTNNTLFGKIIGNSNSIYGIYGIDGQEIVKENSLGEDFVDATNNNDEVYLVSGSFNDYYPEGSTPSIYKYKFIQLESIVVQEISPLPTNQEIEESPIVGEIIESSIDQEKISSENIKFSWKGDENWVYELYIDNIAYTVNGTSYTLEDEIALGEHTWKVKHIEIDGSETWSQEKIFVVTALGAKVEEKIEENVNNTALIAIGAIFVLFLIGFVVRPYYKRSKIKREMSKTSTDWCPNCHKFTGGTKVCPHCGGSTMVETDIKKMSEKIKSKKK